MNTATQVFGDFVYALKCSARLFVGAMPRANATLSAVGAGALTVDAHAHGDKRNADNSQYNNIDRCHSKPPLVNHHLLYPILHLPIRDRFILVGFICGNVTSPPPKSPSVAGTPGLVERGQSLVGLKRKLRRKQCWSRPRRSMHAWAWDGRSGRASQPAARWPQPSRYQTVPTQAGCRTG